MEELLRDYTGDLITDFWKAYDKPPTGSRGASATCTEDWQTHSKNR